MKRFSWSLQRLLDLALQKEQAIQNELMSLASEIASLEAQIRRRQEEVQSQLRELAHQEFPDRLARQENFLRWSTAQEKEIAALAHSEKTLQAKRQQRLKDYAQANSYRKTLEKLRQKSLERYRKEQLKFEQGRLDETAQTAHARKMIERRHVPSSEVMP